MWLEAIVPIADLVRLLADLTPTTIELSAEGELALDSPTEVVLVAGRGLRVTCGAKLRWAVLGLHVPVTIESATVLLEPQLRRGAHGGKDALVFRISFEELSVTAVPTMFEGTVIDRINAELNRPGALLVWDFPETIEHRFGLPKLVQPSRMLDIGVAWGDLRITPEALVFAISVHVKGEETSTRPAAPMVRRVPRELAAPRAVNGTWVAAVGMAVTGFALGYALAHRHAASRAW